MNPYNIDIVSLPYNHDISNEMQFERIGFRRDAFPLVFDFYVNIFSFNNTYP